MTAKFLRIIFWEYLQNLPILAGFAWAGVIWQNGRYALAVAAIVAGSIAGAALIALTEVRKQAEYQEPVAVFLANIAAIAMIMFVVMIYLAAGWSNWLIDMAVGAIGGVGLAIVQSTAARKKINVSHCLALGIASPLLLICIRWLMNTGWSIWITIALMCLLATVVISIIDYAPDVLQQT